MQLAAALVLAVRIHAAAGVELVAIGRFKPLGELAGADDWGISLAINGEPPRILWTADEWTPHEKAARPQPITRTAPREEQPLLF